jgi:hypothetical protein
MRVDRWNHIVLDIISIVRIKVVWEGLGTTHFNSLAATTAMVCRDCWSTWKKTDWQIFTSI